MHHRQQAEGFKVIRGNGNSPLIAALRLLLTPQPLQRLTLTYQGRHIVGDHGGNSLIGLQRLFIASGVEVSRRIGS